MGFVFVVDLETLLNSGYRFWDFYPRVPEPFCVEITFPAKGAFAFACFILFFCLWLNCRFLELWCNGESGLWPRGSLLVPSQNEKISFFIMNLTLSCGLCVRHHIRLCLSCGHAHGAYVSWFFHTYCWEIKKTGVCLCHLFWNGNLLTQKFYSEDELNFIYNF